MRVARTVVVVAVGVGLAAAAAFYGFVGKSGLAADRFPGWLESAIARRLVRVSIPAGARTSSHPSDANAWRDAVDHFSEHCAVCHGADGRGHSAIGSKMYPPAPDLSSDAIQQFSDGELFWIIQHGVSWTGMPAFRSSHSEEETWQLVSFVRHTPTLTLADIQRREDRQARHHAAAATVVIDGTQFQPGEVTVTVGDTIEWVNRDPFPHNVASDAGGFHSGEMDPDRSWQFRPTARGTFTYVCTLHPTMVAVLHVK
jgi:plastocyanin/cytochrome c553